nr:hypothetical protein [Tanacetum cinerariifolium]
MVLIARYVICNRSLTALHFVDQFRTLVSLIDIELRGLKALFRKGEIDSESEEIEDFLNEESIQFGVEDSPFNMDKDILFLENKEFDFEIDFEKEISVERNLIVKFECIDARMKFDDVFKFIMFSLLSAESEDTIFDP